MKKLAFRSRAPWLAFLALTLLATPVFAQVPQDMTYTGRLVDNLGDPLAGPVDLELRIFDEETSGNLLYSEEHLGVPLDETGGFSVQLGLGTSPSGGPFDADLFSEVDRWLEVVVDSEVMAPRQIIGSVPWALVAERANEIVPAGPIDLYVDAASGDDGNDGLTSVTAKQTIQAAVNAIPMVLSGNATVHIAGEVDYNESVWISARQRTALAQIRLVGVGRDLVVLKGDGISDGGIVVLDPFVEVGGMTIKNFDSGSAVIATAGVDLSLVDCSVNDNVGYAGLRVTRGAEIEIEGCDFTNNTVAIRAQRGGHVRLSGSGSSRSNFNNNGTGLLAETNSSIEMESGSGQWCTMEESPMLARDHSTIGGYDQCSRDAPSHCTDEDASARCVP